MGATTIAAPSERLAQQLEALACANEVRSRRARLNRDLKAGRRPIEEMLSDPPEYGERDDPRPARLDAQAQARQGQ